MYSAGAARGGIRPRLRRDGEAAGGQGAGLGLTCAAPGGPRAGHVRGCGGTGGSGHFPHLARPDAFARVLAATADWPR